MVEKQPGATPEKRQVERKYLVFYLRVFDGLSSKVVGHLVNISSGGIMLLTDAPVPLNAEYRLRMRLPHEFVDPPEVVFPATSRWCRNDTNPDFFVVGFQLHDVSPPLQDLIRRLIDEFGCDR